MNEKIHRNSLRPGHALHWYRIRHVLGQGGFGITYLAHDTNLDEDVAIKEYLPIELAVREGDLSVHPISEDKSGNFKWGLDRFINEARTLSKFKHPNIVRVRSVFEENNTAYMVMEYEHGESLQDILTRRKTLEEAELLKILIPVLGGLEMVHQAGFIHRDIKPANIFIRRDGSPVLLDFGSARQSLGQMTKTLTSLVSPGYAPFEQYYSKSDEQGPWTDIYGLGATLYRAIAGRTPQDAVDRSKSILDGSKDLFVPAVEIGKGRYSERFLRAIDHALRFKQKERPQTIAEWKKEFGIEKDIAEIKIAKSMEAAPTQPGTRIIRHRSRKIQPAIAGITTLLVVVAVTAFYFAGDISTFVREITAGRQLAQEEKTGNGETERQRLLEEQKRIAEEQRLKEEQEKLRLAELEKQRLAEEQKKLEEEKRLAEEKQLKEEEEKRLAEEARLAELEKQQQEAARLKAEEERKLEEEQKRMAEEQRLVEEQKKLEEEKRLAEEKQLKEEEEKRLAEEARLAELEKQRLEEETRQKAEAEKKAAFDQLIAEAKTALQARDKSTAVQKYNDALALYPDDSAARQGLAEANALKHPLCYEVLGTWEWDKLFGKDIMILKEDGSIDYQTTIRGSGSWECTAPENRIIKIRLSAGGFSNEWLSNYSPDGSCLTGPGGAGQGCYHRPGATASSAKPAETAPPETRVTSPAATPGNSVTLQIDPVPGELQQWKLTDTNLRETIVNALKKNQFEITDSAGAMQMQVNVKAEQFTACCIPYVKVNAIRDTSIVWSDSARGGVSTINMQVFLEQVERMIDRFAVAHKNNFQ
jgi:serine/threonine protein kinase